MDILKEELVPQLHSSEWDIVHTLLQCYSARFNELKPSDMDPKLFTYHLKKLIGLGLVLHNDRGEYLLSEIGKNFTDYFKERITFKNLPVNTFICLYCKQKGKILVVKRKRAPFLDYTGIPSFDTERDKFMLTTAERSLKGLHLRGNISLSLIQETLYKDKNGSILMHQCMYVFYCPDAAGFPLKENEEGSLFWMRPNDLLKAKKGYDDTVDTVKFFENKKQIKGTVKVLSKVFTTPR